jgi:hypothetical protein
MRTLSKLICDILIMFLCYGLTFAEAQPVIHDPMQKPKQVKQPFYTHKKPGLRMIICSAEVKDSRCRALIGDHWVRVGQYFDGHLVSSISKNSLHLKDTFGPKVTLYLSRDLKQAH